MNSFIKRGNNYNIPIMEIYGLSTDEKPLKDETGMDIPNGSYYLEIDTLNLYFFNSETKQWITK